MAITLLIPTALRSFTDRQSEVEVAAATVGDAVKALGAKYPDLNAHLFDDHGELRSFINLFVGDRKIEKPDGLTQPLADGETVMLVPAIAGGKPINNSQLKINN
ncbi:molybdopterin synthase sulfur carrier subunit [Planctomycetales bacterium]|nr:molybdopterin synthase sulfur carrier subunit [Planctomycetales bacterium]